jgi:hypothetical protein
MVVPIYVEYHKRGHKKERIGKRKDIIGKDTIKVKEVAN